MDTKPWNYKADDVDWGFIRDSAGYLVAVCKGATEAESIEHRRNKTDPYKAKAILIAAAPELLESLKHIREIGGFSGLDHLNSVAALIAKAEGRAE